MPGFGSFSFLDHGEERSSTSFYTGNVTAVSLPGLLTQFGALRTAIEGITLGTVTQEELSVFRTKLSNVVPADENAQRERKWLVIYEDSQAFFDPGIDEIPNAGFRKVFNFELPTALLTGQLQTNSDEADLTTTEMAAFKTAFEAIARSPYGGTVTVLKLVAVGRNL